MPVEFDREGVPKTLSLAPEASAAVIPVNRLGGGSVQVTGAVTIDIYACNKNNPGGETFVPLYEDEETAAAQLVCSGAGVWELPPAIYSTRYIKLVHASDTSEVYIWLQA
jgi:hypothetical protein